MCVSHHYVKETAMNDLNPVIEAQTHATQTDEAPVAAESLIEEVSIDGMCGVY